MRWEYCTKVTFKKNGFAEWHSWATYLNERHFSKLFNNYLKYRPKPAGSEKQWDQIDPNVHLTQIDLAIYDQTGFRKVMLDAFSSGHSFLKSLKQMTCEERLSHALQIQKIKIYPNATSIVEDFQKRDLSEVYEKKIQQNSLGNEYFKESDTEEVDKAMHENQAKNDQTWYFVLADCKGTLEIYQDEQTKREHLLGLDVLWQNLNATDNLSVPTHNTPRENRNQDSFEETELMNENTVQQRVDRFDDDDEDDENEEVFNWEAYAKEHEFGEVGSFQEHASENKLVMKNMPIKVTM